MKKKICIISKTVKTLISIIILTLLFKSAFSMNSYFFETRSTKEKIKIIIQWSNKLDEESKISKAYYARTTYDTPGRKFIEQTSSLLFTDNFFVPHFGISYEKLTESHLREVLDFLEVIKKPKHRKSDVKLTWQTQILNKYFIKSNYQMFQSRINKLHKSRKILLQRAKEVENLSELSVLCERIKLFGFYNIEYDLWPSERPPINEINEDCKKYEAAQKRIAQEKKKQEELENKYKAAEEQFEDAFDKIRFDNPNAETLKSIWQTMGLLQNTSPSYQTKWNKKISAFEGNVRNVVINNQFDKLKQIQSTDLSGALDWYKEYRTIFGDIILVKRKKSYEDADLLPHVRVETLFLMKLGSGLETNMDHLKSEIAAANRPRLEEMKRSYLVDDCMELAIYAYRKNHPDQIPYLGALSSFVSKRDKEIEEIERKERELAEQQRRKEIGETIKTTGVCPCCENNPPNCYLCGGGGYRYRLDWDTSLKYEKCWICRGKGWDPCYCCHRN